MKHEVRKALFAANVSNAVKQAIKGDRIFMSKTATIGNLIFVSSLSGKNMKTGEWNPSAEGQVEGCLNNLNIALNEAGSTIENLVKITILIRDVKNCPVIWGALLEYLQKNAPALVNAPPAVSVIPVSGFLEGKCKIEISAEAVVTKDEPGWEIRKFPMLIQEVNQVYPNIKQGMPFCSESVAVGNLLFLSSMSAVNSKSGLVQASDFEDQMDIAFNKVMKALDNAGSSPSNIIKTLHLLGRLEDVPSQGRDLQVSHSPASDRLWKRELEHYDQYAPFLLEEFPASTFLKLSELPVQGELVELDIMSVISRYKKGCEVKNYPLYYGRRGFPRHIGEIKKYYANSIVLGNLVIVSGQTPTDPYTGKIETDEFEEQVKVALNNLKHAVEEAGSCLENIAKTNILLPDKTKYSAFRKLEGDFYTKYAPSLCTEPPASTFICPFNLASPKMQIEIEAFAYRASY